MSEPEEKKSERPCELHLTLLSADSLCGCGWMAGEHRDHPSRRERPPAPESAKENGRLRAIVAAHIIANGGEPISVPRDAADALDGELLVTLTPTAYVVAFEVRAKS